MGAGSGGRAAASVEVQQGALRREKDGTQIGLLLYCAGLGDWRWFVAVVQSDLRPVVCPCSFASSISPPYTVLSVCVHYFLADLRTCNLIYISRPSYLYLDKLNLLFLQQSLMQKFLYICNEKLLKV